MTPVPAASLPGAQRKYRSLFCSFTLPRHPGFSGGEIRDFYLLQHLLTVSRVEFFAIHGMSPLALTRKDLLAPLLEGLHTPETVRPDLLLEGKFPDRFAHRLRRPFHDHGLPVWGPRHHWEAAQGFRFVHAFARHGLPPTLARDPDFLFVSPQHNPVALALNLWPRRTRMVLASYDVEAVRVRRLAEAERGLRRLGLRLEARRAIRFEADNLAHFDGVIAVSELDRQHFVRDYGFEPERVLVIENGVDLDYFAFRPRTPAPAPSVVFTGSMGYAPNTQAAWRLVHRIMPRVRERQPDARLWLVGQYPPPDLVARSDGHHTVVTGNVEDVRSYLTGAAVGCVPLESGSGTKYKVLEALSAGVPLVCTHLALEGLDLQDGRHVRTADSDEGLAVAILDLLAHPEKGVVLARAGREKVEQAYAWERNLPRLEPWLDRLMELPKRRP